MTGEFEETREKLFALAVNIVFSEEINIFIQETLNRRPNLLCLFECLNRVQYLKFCQEFASSYSVEKDERC